MSALLVAEELQTSELQTDIEQAWDEALAFERQREIERAWDAALAENNWRHSPQDRARLLKVHAAFEEQKRLEAEWLADPMNRLRNYEIKEEMKRIRDSKRKTARKRA